MERKNMFEVILGEEKKNLWNSIVSFFAKMRRDELGTEKRQKWRYIIKKECHFSEIIRLNSKMNNYGLTSNQPAIRSINYSQPDNS